MEESSCKSSLFDDTAEDDILNILKENNEKAKNKKKKWFHSELLNKNCEEILNQWLKSDTFEFESSFGIKKKDYFNYGMEKKHFVKILNKIEKKSEWKCFEQKWNNLAEINFEKNVRLVKNPLIGDHFIPEWKSSIRIENISLDNCPLDVRLSLNVEINTQSLKYANIRKYRFKNRKSFIKNPFRLDFTVIKQGDTVQEANKSKPIYQVEIEWIKDKDINNNDFLKYKNYLIEFFEIIDDFLSLLGSDEKLHNFATKVHRNEKNDQLQITNSKKKSLPPSTSPKQNMMESFHSEDLSYFPPMSNSPLKLNHEEQQTKKRGRKPNDKNKCSITNNKQKKQSRFSSFEFLPKERKEDSNPSIQSQDLNPSIQSQNSNPFLNPFITTLDNNLTSESFSNPFQ